MNRKIEKEIYQDPKELCLENDMTGDFFLLFRFLNFLKGGICVDPERRIL